MIDEKPLMKPLALIRSCILVRAVIASGLDQASFSPSNAAWKTSGPPIRSKRNSSHIMLVHRDWPPRENGAMPCVVELRDQRHDVVPRGGGLRADLLEDGLVVVEHDGLHRLARHRVDLAVDGGRAEGGREELVLDVGVLVEPRGEVLDLAGVDVGLEPATAPAPDDRGGLAGADGRLDLRLVGVVLERRLGDLGARVGGVEAVDGTLADALTGLAGEVPVGGAGACRACAARGGAAARSGAAARGEGTGQRDAHGEPEEGTTRGGSGIHVDLHMCRGRGTAGSGVTSSEISASENAVFRNNLVCATILFVSFGCQGMCPDRVHPH